MMQLVVGGRVGSGMLRRVQSWDSCRFKASMFCMVVAACLDGLLRSVIGGWGCLINLGPYSDGVDPWLAKGRQALEARYLQPTSPRCLCHC